MRITILAALLLTSTVYAGTAFLTGSYISGQNKICMYDYLGSQYVINVRSYKLCPISIQINR